MYVLVSIGIILAVLILLLMITPVTIELSYSRQSEDDELQIHIRIWHGLIRFRYELPFIDFERDGDGFKISAEVKRDGNKLPYEEFKKALHKRQIANYFHRVQRIIEHVQDFYPIIRGVLQHISCQKLEWITAIGVGDAAATGTLIGLVTGVKNMLVGMLSYYISLQEMPSIRVEPMWNDNIIRTQFHCVLFFRVGHAIVAAVRIVIKLRKGSASRWQSTPSKA
ncbi:DUF2953 domain-containing protein [Brevibacillus daliensis]|uniref:DUF2953 domain-containing protein n=1 Tax=Brevibacillus daliensis TaxID=2892995 RepID=UPI001E56C607|nr:DUF2953 domain-containing protein [Brevibacillus daliensis]